MSFQREESRRRPAVQPAGGAGESAIVTESQGVRTSVTVAQNFRILALASDWHGLTRPLKEGHICWNQPGETVLVRSQARKS